VTPSTKPMSLRALMASRSALSTKNFMAFSPISGV